MLGRASSATEGFGTALGIAGEQVSGGGALAEEASKRFETFESKVLILRNKLNDLAITIGGPVVDALSTVLDAVGPVIDSIAEFASENPNLTATLVGVTGALGLAAAAIGPVVFGVGQVLAQLPLFSAQLASVTSAAGTAGLAGTIGTLGAALVPIAGLVAGAAAAFVLWGDDIPDVVRGLQELRDVIAVDISGALAGIGVTAAEAKAVHRELARQIRSAFRRGRDRLLRTGSEEEWAAEADQVVDALFVDIQRSLEAEAA